MNNTEYGIKWKEFTLKVKQKFICNECKSCRKLVIFEGDSPSELKVYCLKCHFGRKIKKDE